jgi:hypothetical protein
VHVPQQEELYQQQLVEAIYGVDDRRDAKEENALSIAAKVIKSFVVDNGDGYSTIKCCPLSEMLEDYYNYPCDPSVPFATQVSGPIVGTGFLVAENVICTAKHCVFEDDGQEEDKDAYCWVFGLRADESAEANQYIVPNQHIFTTTHLLQFPGDDDRDWALLYVEKDTSFLPKLALHDGEPEIGEELCMLGHPSGLPMKYTDGGRVVALTEHALNHTLDAFKGNSGSPVLRRANNTVCGVMAAGQEDYFVDKTTSTVKVNVVDISTVDEDNSEEAQRTDRVIRKLLEHCPIVNVEIILSHEGINNSSNSAECTVTISDTRTNKATATVYAPLNILETHTVSQLVLRWDTLATYLKTIEVTKHQAAPVLCIRKLSITANSVVFLDWNGEVMLTNEKPTHLIVLGQL